MAKYIFDRLKIKASVRPCKTADFVSPAKRPLNSCFDCTKISRLIDETIGSWQDSLDKFLEKI
jgi:dTDP-4-dehydrorhamnose reductase